MDNLSVNDYQILKSALQLKAQQMTLYSPARKDLQRLYTMIEDLQQVAAEEAERARQARIMDLQAELDSIPPTV